MKSYHQFYLTRILLLFVIFMANILLFGKIFAFIEEGSQTTLLEPTSTIQVDSKNTVADTDINTHKMLEVAEGKTTRIGKFFLDIKSYCKERIDLTAQWYKERNIQTAYLKGVIQIKILDFLLLLLGILWGGYGILKILMRN